MNASSHEVDKRLSDACADVIYRSTRYICPCVGSGNCGEMVKVERNPYLWECPECGYSRCTIGLRDEGK